MRTLRPYQDLMIDWIINTTKCALWSFMGSGKTAAVLHAVDRLMLGGSITKPTLVVAPLRVARDVWPVEVGKWSEIAHLRVVPILGSPVHRMEALRIPADIYTINFENVEWLINTWGQHWPYGMIVIDESTKLKSLRANIRTNKGGTKWIQGQGGKRAKALLKATFEHKTERFVELTGTPSPHGLQDLWGQIFYLDHGRRLGRLFDSFQTRWFRYNFDGFGLEPLPYAQEQIQAAIKDLCLALKSEDWFDVEQPIVKPIYIDLPTKVRGQYRELERQMFTEIQTHPIEAFNAGARTMKLLQMASGAVYLGRPDDPGERKWVAVHEEKLNALDEVLEEAAGMPVLVGYTFKSDLARILKRFPKAVHFDNKKGIQARWDDGEIPMLVAHPASMGHGLNLQDGSNILTRFSSDWNGEQFDQMLERIGPVRQMQSGHPRNVFDYRVIAMDTVDEDVYVSHAEKRSVQDALMDGMRRRLDA